MSKLNLRYLLTALVASLLVALGFQRFVSSILIPEMQAGLVGAAFIAGWWGNLITTFVVAIMGARKAARELIDPRLGRIVGTAMGVWVGVGAAAGNVIAALILAGGRQAALKTGLVAVFSLISLIVALVSANIAGRETAQPPEEEEEAV
ncbi:MAG: hypothetical protein NTZ50_05345 [Chloroflexi bacterium]|nr:hypothetical protein [Chloroflexota bacterium]